MQPLLLVFEDLHWIDGETQALLDSLVESLPSARLLLLVNYRPEYQHRWGSKTYYSQLRLDPLPPESAEELLEALLGDRSRARAAQAAPDRADGGQPVLSGGERPDAGGDGGAGRRARRLPAGAAVQTIQVPATVQAVLAARIDRLAPEDKRLLQVASVIGKDVPFALLQAIAELPDEALRRGSPTCRPPSSSTRPSLFPDLEYTFKHALTHEVPTAACSRSGAAPSTRGSWSAIEAIYPDRLGEQVERLAHHALRGELREKAVDYLRQAGVKAAARSALPEAGGWFEQALDVLDALPETVRHWKRVSTSGSNCGRS